MLLCLSRVRMMFWFSFLGFIGMVFWLLGADKTGKGHSGWRAGSY